MAFKNLLRFVLEIFFSKRQAVVASIMFGALSSVLLFYLFFKTFQTYYIDELKSIYPTMYIATNKKVDENVFENSKALSEIFELNWRDFVIGLNEGTYYSLGSIGMRSFHREFIPKILKDFYVDENTIYVSNTLFELLESQKLFKNIFYIESDKDNKKYKFNVKSFDLHDSAKWVLMSDKVSHKIYRGGSFNKVVFYSQLEDTLLYKIIKDKFNQPVMSWDEHISLSSRALKESMVYIFLLLTLAIIVLVISSFVFFAQSILDDLIITTRYAFFHGINLSKIFFMYFIILNIYLGVIYMFSYISSSFLNTRLVDIIWGFEAQNSISISNLTLVVESMMVVLLFSYLFMTQKSTGTRMSRG